jgi:predicted nucleotidyltransferase
MVDSVRSNVQLGQAERKRVLAIVSRRIPGAVVWVFGARSRAAEVRDCSDLDLVVDIGRKMELSELAELREDFRESNLPISVDVVDLRAMDTGFRSSVEPDFVSLEDSP